MESIMIATLISVLVFGVLVISFRVEKNRMIANDQIEDIDTRIRKMASKLNAIEDTIMELNVIKYKIDFTEKKLNNLLTSWNYFLNKYHKLENNFKNYERR